MKLKKLFISILSLVTLASCNRGTSADNSVTSAPASDETSTSSTATKSNQLTKEMFAELAKGYSIEETVSGYNFITLNGEDYQTNYLSYIQYIDSNDNVLHLKAGKSNDDTKKDPVKPESFETTNYDLYYVSEDDNDGKIYANSATLSLNNEPKYTKLYNSSTTDPNTGETVYSDRVEWYTLFSPAFSQFTASDFTKITDSVRTFRFTAPEEKDEDLSHALEVFSYQIFGMGDSLNIETITLHTDGYHIIDFQATATYSRTQEVKDDKNNTNIVGQELELTAKGNFTSVGGAEIETFSPAVGTSDSTFDDAMNALRQDNFKFSEAHYVSKKADGNFRNKPTDKYSGVMDGNSFIYYDSSRITSEDQATDREGIFQIDDNHYAIAKELHGGSEDNPTSSWYRTADAMEGKLTDFIPSYKISPLLFDDEDGIKIFRLKKEYMKIVNFTSGAFDILKPNNGSSISGTDSSTGESTTYDLTDFSIDLSSYEAEGTVVFTYVYDSEKYVITYTDINKVTKENIPTLKWANIHDNVTFTDDGKTSLYEMWGLKDDDLTDKLLEQLPIIPGNSGLAISSDFKMIGYVIQADNASALSSARSALTQFISLFEGMGFTGDRINQATEEDANKTGKVADYIYTKDYKHTDGKTYTLTSHVLIYMVQIENSNVLFVGYSFAYALK